MKGLLDTLDKKGRGLAPTFAFIDPFGFSGASMNLIARLAQNRKCECLVTFMYESVNRFLAHTNKAIQARFDQLFGTRRWRELARLPNPDNRRDEISGLYRKQLLQQAQFRYVRTFEMINEGNRTEYFLYFGTNSATGLSKMKETMWRADPIGGQVFSDRTDPNQMVLIQKISQYDSMSKLLRQRFKGQRLIEIEEVEQFVLEDTPYSERIHLKRLTLKPMEQSVPPKSVS